MLEGGEEGETSRAISSCLNCSFNQQTKKKKKKRKVLSNIVEHSSRKRQHQDLELLLSLSLFLSLLPHPLDHSSRSGWKLSWDNEIYYNFVLLLFHSFPSLSLALPLTRPGCCWRRRWYFNHCVPRLLTVFPVDWQNIILCCGDGFKSSPLSTLNFSK